MSTLHAQLMKELQAAVKDEEYVREQMVAALVTAARRCTRLANLLGERPELAISPNGELGPYAVEVDRLCAQLGEARNLVRALRRVSEVTDAHVDRVTEDPQ